MSDPADPVVSTHIRQTRLRVAAVDAEVLADRLWGYGVAAIEEIACGDGRIELRTVVGELALDELSADFSGPLDIEIVNVNATPAETWREFAQPVRLGTLVLCPAWLTVTDMSATDQVVMIEPGGSFGLGDHPTTMMAAEQVARYVTSGSVVLDVGAGSGVLSIVAAQLGASVVATEISTVAIDAMGHNLVLNHVADQVRVVHTDNLDGVMGEGEADLVVANISAQVLRPMMSDLVARCRIGGHIIMTGVLADQNHEVDTVAIRNGARIIERVRNDAWECLVAVRDAVSSGR